MSAPEESTSATRQSTCKMRHDWRYIWEPGGEQFRKTRATLGRTAPNRSSRFGYGRKVHFERAKYPPMLLVPIAYFCFILWSPDFYVRTFIICAQPHRRLPHTTLGLRAPAGTATAHTAIAASVSGHDRAAKAAAGRVSHVHHTRQSIGGVHRPGSGPGTGRTEVADFGRRAHRFRSQVLKQELLLAGQKAHMQPAEDVVHDRFGKADLGIVRPAARFKTSVGELLTQQL